MIFFKKPPVYYCKHCGKKHKSAFMAQICFELDMKILQSEKMNRKEKIKMFIKNSESLNSLTLIYEMYNIDILYDNELSKLFFEKKRKIKAKFETWGISWLN